MNYGVLKSTLLARLSMGTDDPAAADVDGLINEALHLVETAHPAGWPWLRRTQTFTTTASVSTYSLSSIDTTYTIMKVLDVKSAYQTYYQALELMSPQEADRTFASTTGTDIPQFYFVEGQTLHLYPTPSGAYTTVVRSVISEPDLSSDTASPLMPSAFHTAIIAAGIVLYYEELQDTQRMIAAGQRLDSWIKRMESYARENGATPRIRYRGI